MAPFTLCRDHILMAHQKDWVFAAFSLPVIEKVSIDHCFFKLFVDEWKQLLQELVEAEKFFLFMDSCM